MVNKKKLEKPILREGEVTGHAHVLPEDVDVYEVEGGVKEFDLGEEKTLKHEEHGPIQIPKGKFASDAVVEFDHFAEEARRVAD